jgi:hypothetical protein
MEVVGETSLAAHLYPRVNAGDAGLFGQSRTVEEQGHRQRQGRDASNPESVSHGPNTDISS